MKTTKLLFATIAATMLAGPALAQSRSGMGEMPDYGAAPQAAGASASGTTRAVLAPVGEAPAYPQPLMGNSRSAVAAATTASPARAIPQTPKATAGLARITHNHENFERTPN